MVRRHDRQVLLMALIVLGATGLSAVGVPGAVPFGDALGRVLVPLQRVLVGAAAATTDVFSSARDLRQLRDVNAGLEARNAELMAESTKMNDLIRENRALRDELGFARERIDLDLLGASVSGAKVAEEAGNLRHSIRLDVGTRDGIRQWMPVANHVGLVGQVVHAAAYWCDVMLITDPVSRVQARIARSRHTGVVSGSPLGELVMRYIPQETGDGEPIVQTGDLVYTSGQSEHFPPDILIGQVTEVRQSDEQTHQEAVIRPAVDFGTLEIALVVHDWLPPEAADAVAPSGAADPARP